MSNESSRPQGVSLWAHPATALVVSTLSLVATAVFVTVGSVSLPQVWKSFVLGSALGLPSALLVKWIMGRHVYDYARFFTIPWFDRPFWQPWNLLCGVAVLIPMEATIVLAWYLGLHWLLTVWLELAWSVIIYPEQKKIWRAANELVARPRGSED